MHEAVDRMIEKFSSKRTSMDRPNSISRYFVALSGFLCAFATLRPSFSINREVWNFTFRNWAVLVACVLGAIGCAYSAQPLPPPGECPQPRFTGKAPEEYYSRKNPLEASKKNLKAAQRLYAGGIKSFGCAPCHGKKGDGKGELASQFVPRPRNFACAQTVNDIPDGQLYWITRFGSPGTSMPAHEELGDEQLWQLVLYLRKLAQ